jgi:hypothetical protein
MTDYTPEEVDAAIEAADPDYGSSWIEIYYEDFGFDTLELRGEAVPFEVVEMTGDGEWQYDLSCVIKVGDQFFRRTGYYRSHDGAYLDSATSEVVEGTKEVKVWKNV